MLMTGIVSLMIHRYTINMDIVAAVKTGVKQIFTLIQDLPPNERQRIDLIIFNNALSRCDGATTDLDEPILGRRTI